MPRRRSQASLLLSPPPGRQAPAPRRPLLGRGRPERPRRTGRRGLRRGVRAAVALAGVTLTAAGALTVFRVETGPRSLAGGATSVPSTVRMVAPATPVTVAAQLRPSVPVRILIPSLGVDAPVMLLGQAADGSLQVPPLANHDLAGWYDRSVTPGRDGTSVILGHVDSYTGVSVFYNLRYLAAGAVVEVMRADGSTAEFAVDGVREVAKATFPSQQIYGNTPYPGLRLITCGGPFDSTTRQYLDNIVVYAHLIH